MYMTEYVFKAVGEVTKRVVALNQKNWDISYNCNLITSSEIIRARSINTYS